MCLLAIAANFTEEVTVLVVHLNMNATNVTKTIQAVSAIFVPQDPSPQPNRASRYQPQSEQID